ncbi:MAG: alpha-1,4-glucan--maltose-1-phosphate maltosyltransferase, partial [Bacteroidota bacterium]
MKPEIDGGRFPVKRVPGEILTVTADIFTDGHDEVTARLIVWGKEETSSVSLPMKLVVNDHWKAYYTIKEQHPCYYTVEAWVDHFKTWQHDLKKKADADVATGVDVLAGLILIREAIDVAVKDESEVLEGYINKMEDENRPLEERINLALDNELTMLMQKNPVKKYKVTYDKKLKVEVDRKKALFSAWYEIFPRSAKLDGSTHGTFRDVENLIPYIKSMGFDVLYLPPVHPIGKNFRKGKNNSIDAQPDDVGSPWAIGSEEGGHKSIHPDLGTMDDFKSLVKKALANHIEVAIDIAFQCAPDHPYVKEHPEWFKKRPDGSIQYAENPPKKYQDIYPFDFESNNWKELWEELKDVFLFWVDKGIKIFRVDNPHNKPFNFWEWVITEVRKKDPNVLFLAEAFTRPKVMSRLAKVGFNQSYTYFSWRNMKWELSQYMETLTKTPMVDFFRPNFWPNTPDILTEYLQSGGRPAFMIRLVLAATLSSSYGIYGPAFELIENRAKEFGSEEYLDSEKYQLRSWNIQDKKSLKGFIERINSIRNENPAFQNFKNLSLHQVDNDQIIAYSKKSDDGQNIILTVVNLDPHHTHSGWIHIPLSEFKMEEKGSYQVYDLLTHSWYIWSGEWNYVELNPHDS